MTVVMNDLRRVSVCLIFSLLWVTVSWASDDELSAAEYRVIAESARAQKEPAKSRTFRFTTPGDEKSAVALLNQLVLSDAFEKLGFRYENCHLPPRRRVEMMRREVMDGDSMRVSDFREVSGAPDAYVRVNVQIGESVMLAVSLDETVRVSSYEELLKSELSFSFVKGNKIIEGVLPSDIDPARVYVQLMDNHSSLRQIKKGHIDIHLMGFLSINRRNVYDVVQRMGLHVAGELPGAALYPFLNRKNVDILESFTAALQEVKVSGRYDEYVSRVQEAFRRDQARK